MASPREIVQIGRKPPLERWVKLNTDDFCRGIGLTGCGGVIRGSDGEWLGGFAKGVGMCSTYIVKLYGVFEVCEKVRFHYR